MGLKDFAERFANNIFSVFPEWREYGRRLEYDEFEIAVPAPTQKDKNDFLWMFVEEEDEMIVRFDTYYGYFFTCCYDSEHDWLNDIVKFIQGILDETLVVATTLQDNQRKWEVIEVNTLPDFPRDILHIRSWNGTFDRDYFI